MFPPSTDLAACFALEQSVRRRWVRPFHLHTNQHFTFSAFPLPYCMEHHSFFLYQPNILTPQFTNKSEHKFLGSLVRKLDSKVSLRPTGNSHKLSPLEFSLGNLAAGSLEVCLEGVKGCWVRQFYFAH